MGKANVDDDYTYKGYRLVILENDYMKVVVLPEKGSDILQFLDKRNGIDYLWKTPIGLPSRRRSAPAGYGNESSFSNSYEGGWQAVFPNGGSSCFYKGVNLEMCGDAACSDWKYRVLDTGPDAVRVVFETKLDRMPYKLKRIFDMNGKEAVLKVTETALNEGEEDLAYMWGQHVAFEGSLLRGGGWKLRVSCGKVLTNTGALVREAKPPAGRRLHRLPADGEFSWPMVKDAEGRDADLSLFPGPEVKTCDIAYLRDLAEGAFTLANPSLRTEFRFSWDKELFPYVWYYQNYGGSFEYPWYGRGNGIALEPITSFPALGLEEAISRNNHRTLRAGEKIETLFEARLLHGSETQGS